MQSKGHVSLQYADRMFLLLRQCMKRWIVEPHPRGFKLMPFRIVRIHDSLHGRTGCFGNMQKDQVIGMCHTSR